MPVSPLKWGAYPKPDVTEIYTSYIAAKRKPDDEETLESCMQSSPEFKPKRVCMWTVQEEERMSVHAMIPEEAMDLTSQRQMAGNTLSSQPHDATPLSPSNRECHRHQMSAQDSHQQLAMDHMDSQSGMVMNINDDDGEEQYASACQLMDGEAAIDFNQYGSKAASQHEQHCFGEETSPNSGTTRCYCRPTWDNLGANQSFFSDIY